MIFNFYQRVILSTGKTERLPFTENQAIGVHRQGEFIGLNGGYSEKTALELVNLWNKSTTTLKYFI